MIRWLLLLLLLAGVGSASAQPADITRIADAEAVRADWQSPAPPAQGWVQVALADQWQTRWPIMTAWSGIGYVGSKPTPSNRLVCYWTTPAWQPLSISTAV